MTRSEFDPLSEIDKLSVIMEEGILLSQDHFDDHRHFLYRVFEFYVAVSYKDAADRLVEIRSCDEPIEIIAAHHEAAKSKDPASRIQENP